MTADVKFTLLLANAIVHLLPHGDAQCVGSYAEVSATVDAGAGTFGEVTSTSAADAAACAADCDANPTGGECVGYLWSDSLSECRVVSEVLPTVYTRSDTPWTLYEESCAGDPAHEVCDYVPTAGKAADESLSSAGAGVLTGTVSTHRQCMKRCVTGEWDALADKCNGWAVESAGSIRNCYVYDGLTQADVDGAPAPGATDKSYTVNVITCVQQTTTTSTTTTTTPTTTTSTTTTSTPTTTTTTTTPTTTTTTPTTTTTTPTTTTTTPTTTTTTPTTTTTTTTPTTTTTTTTPTTTTTTTTSACEWVDTGALLEPASASGERMTMVPLSELEATYGGDCTAACDANDDWCNVVLFDEAQSRCLMYESISTAAKKETSSYALHERQCLGASVGLADFELCEATVAPGGVDPALLVADSTKVVMGSASKGECERLCYMNYLFDAFKGVKCDAFAWGATGTVKLLSTCTGVTPADARFWDCFKYRFSRTLKNTVMCYLYAGVDTASVSAAADDSSNVQVCTMSCAPL